MRLSMIAILAVAWAVATFGIAFAVVEWRQDSAVTAETAAPTPDFYCKSALEAYLNAVAQPDITNARLDWFYDNYTGNCAAYDDELPDPSPSQ